MRNLNIDVFNNENFGIKQEKSRLTEVYIMDQSDTSLRRSTAAQYFMDDSAPGTAEPHQKVVEWLNEASINNDPTVKGDLLRRVIEIIVHKDPNLLDNFLDEVLAFQTDRSADIRKLIIGFIEEACKKDSELIPKVLPNLQMLLLDSSAQVQKRVIQAVIQVYRLILQWISKARVITDDMQAVWNTQSTIKKMVIDMVDNNNDGIRTLTVKFLENLVLLQTYPEPDSQRRENDFSLEDIPLGLKIARRRKLEEEAVTVFDLMIKFHGSPHISSANLMACMGALTLVAKSRPRFMGKVVAALETLHTNLPPTLTNSQVSSVRKHLKLQLLNLLKHPAAMDFIQNIAALLTDLGASYQEIAKVYPKPEELKKRLKRAAAASSEATSISKKSRVESTVTPPLPVAPGVAIETGIDVTQQFITERLTPELATDLVIMAMAHLPDTMPSLFSATYTPIAKAGTQSQIIHVARLLATQLNAVGLGPGASLIKETASATKMDDDDDEDAEDSKRKIPTLITSDGPPVVPPPPSLLLLSGKHPKRKALKLTEITIPLSEPARQRMAILAVQRILRTEKSAMAGGVLPLYSKMIATLAATFGPAIRAAIFEYIVEDISKRLNLVLSWLYEEYSYMQGFNRMPPALKQDCKPEFNYNTLLCDLIKTVIVRIDIRDRETLLYRLYLEAPLITDDAIDILKELCCTEVVGLTILQELVIRRPPRHLLYLNALLRHTAHEIMQVREVAISCIVLLYERGELQSIIEEYAVFYLGFLRLPKPPEVLFGNDRGRPDVSEIWTEEAIRACLYLYLVLLPINQELIHELARVYVQTGADVKRTILRLVEQPVRGMGMHSPELLKLVEVCPKGAETLVTRVIHILTDKTPPSIELVARVRDLYQSRVSDVRFLIPVLNGLTKQEIIAALPKLIKLNPIVVKEVFNRLLGTHSEVNHSSPISPTELLVALHTIDPNKCELKSVIKATSLCFCEKQVYTQEILAIVIQQLMEITPLPTLLMRTVIQALSLYPWLIGFVMNVLQRLILKQVWRQKKVWEGFIKCCQRTKPQSFQVLLQLPAPQLADVLINSPDLRQPLLEHVLSFTENQRAHIPQSVMDVLMGTSQPVFQEFNIKTEPQSPPELTIDIKEEPEDFTEPAPPGLD